MVFGTLNLIHWNHWSPGKAHVPTLFIAGAQVLVMIFLRTLTIMESGNHPPHYAASNWAAISTRGSAKKLNARKGYWVAASNASRDNAGSFF